MARGVKHSDATKAAVLVALFAGQGVSATAKAFKLHRSLVDRWKNELPDGELRQVATLKRNASMSCSQPTWKRRCGR
jgi:hypothetical protein